MVDRDWGYQSGETPISGLPCAVRSIFEPVDSSKDTIGKSPAPNSFRFLDLPGGNIALRTRSLHTLGILKTLTTQAEIRNKIYRYCLENNLETAKYCWNSELTPSYIYFTGLMRVCRLVRDEFKPLWKAAHEERKAELKRFWNGWLV